MKEHVYFKMKSWYVEIPAKVIETVEAETEEDAVDLAYDRASKESNPEIELIEDYEQVVVVPD